MPRILDAPSAVDPATGTMPSGTPISPDPTSCAVAFEYGRPNIRSITNFFITEFRLKVGIKLAGERVVFNGLNAL